VTTGPLRSRHVQLAGILAVLLVSGAARLRAQERSVHRVSVGALAGTWWIGQGYWPFVLVGAEYQATTYLSLGLQAGGVSRPVEVCPNGLTYPLCDRRKLIRMVAGNVRYELGSGTIRPYVGASLGPTWYHGDGTRAAVHGGAALPVGRRLSFRLDGALNLLIAQDGYGGASSLQAGLYLRL
jgi:hypothetical protein